MRPSVRCSFLLILVYSLTTAFAVVAAHAMPPQVNGKLPMDLTSEAADGRKLESPAQLTKSGWGAYPQHLLNNHVYLSGEVNMVLTLAPDGKVTEIRVVYASHPAFVPPAITRITDSRFAAGRIGGQPVATRAGFQATFDVQGAHGGWVGFDTVRMPNKLAGLPPEYEYDRPPVARSFCESVYPRDLLVGKVEGKAKVRLVLDETGRIAASEVVSATRPEFGAAFRAAAETWTFQPAYRAGVPTKTVIEQEHEFLPAGYRRPEAENSALKELRRDGKNFLTAEQLDRPLHVVYQVAPQYPRSLLATKPTGEAEIEFIVCEDGQVVLPAIVSATQPEFGYAAATAVLQWVFDRPVANGKSATVRKRLSISFAP